MSKIVLNVSDLLGAKRSQEITTPPLTVLAFDAQGDPALVDQTTMGLVSTTATTSGATQTTLAEKAVTLDTITAFEILISGRDDLGNGAAFLISGAVKNIGGSTSMVGTTSVQMIAGDAVPWASADSVEAIPNDGTSILEIAVTGSAARTVSWRAIARYVTA